MGRWGTQRARWICGPVFKAFPSKLTWPHRCWVAEGCGEQGENAVYSAEKEMVLGIENLEIRCQEPQPGEIELTRPARGKAGASCGEHGHRALGQGPCRPGTEAEKTRGVPPLVRQGGRKFEERAGAVGRLQPGRMGCLPAGLEQHHLYFSLISLSQALPRLCAQHLDL